MGKKSRSIEVPLCFDAPSIPDPAPDVDSPADREKNDGFYGLISCKTSQKLGGAYIGFSFYIFNLKEDTRMVVKYVEDFVGLDGQIYESKVTSDCGSIRLVPDCGGLISAVFLYRDNEQNMIIPFSGRDISQKIVYLDNILDIHVASGIIDLSGFKAVKMSRYIELNAFVKTMVKSPLFENVPIDARNVKMDICNAIEFNDDSFEHLFEAIKEE